MAEVELSEESQYNIHSILYTDKSYFKQHFYIYKLSQVSKIQNWTFLTFWAVEHCFLIHQFLMNKKPCILGMIKNDGAPAKWNAFSIASQQNNKSKMLKWRYRIRGEVS